MGFLFFLLKTPRQIANRQPTTQQAKVYASYPFVLRNSWGRFPIRWIASRIGLFSMLISTPCFSGMKF